LKGGQGRKSGNQASIKIEPFGSSSETVGGRGQGCSQGKLEKKLAALKELGRRVGKSDQKGGGGENRDVFTKNRCKG